MSNRTFCDECGKEIQRYFASMDFGVAATTNSENCSKYALRVEIYHHNSSSTPDLCEGCAKEILFSMLSEYARSKP